jgi:hypothetical protein
MNALIVEENNLIEHKNYLIDKLEELNYEIEDLQYDVESMHDMNLEILRIQLRETHSELLKVVAQIARVSVQKEIISSLVAKGLSEEVGLKIAKESEAASL